MASNAQTAYVALGSNLNNPEAQVRAAASLLSSRFSNFEISPLYSTTPVGNPNQPDFINAVCRFSTCLAPLPLFHILEEIECTLGKTPKPKSDPRPIDLDLLFYGSGVFEETGLTIPHPSWRKRWFVLKPLSDLTSTIHLHCQKRGIDETIDILRLIGEVNEKSTC